MPVNRTSKKPLPEAQPEQTQASGDAASQGKAKPKLDALGQETDRDRELALTDAEWKNLWDATEVIDMDTF